MYHQLQRFDSMIKAHEASVQYNNDHINVIGGRVMRNTGVLKDYSGRIKCVEDRVKSLEDETE